MTIHKCDKCGYETLYLTNYKKHIKKKKPCTLTISVNPELSDEERLFIEYQEKLALLKKKPIELQENKKIENKPIEIKENKINSAYEKKFLKYENVTMLNDFFDRITITESDIWKLKNLAGYGSANDKLITFVSSLISQHYINYRSKEKPFFCSNITRHLIHFKQHPYEKKSRIYKRLSEEEMIAEKKTLHLYRDVLDKDGMYCFTETYNEYDRSKSCWKKYSPGEDYNEFFLCIANLLHKVLVAYKNPMKDVTNMLYDVNNDAEVCSPLKIVTTSLKDNNNLKKIMFRLCEMSYIHDIESEDSDEKE